MRRINTFMLIFTISLFTSSSIPKAVSQPYPEYEQEFTWTMPCFAPAKVNINYLYTHNHSIRDISCLGTTSLYRHSGGPENMLFEAEDLDTYKYTVELFYKDITKQHLTVGVWSGKQQVQPVYEYDFYTMHLTIHVTLQVTEEPKFPTAEETAEATLDRLEKTLVELNLGLEERTTKQEQMLWMFTIVSAICLVVSFGSAIAVVKIYKKR